MSEPPNIAEQPWFRKLDATQWKTLFAPNFGWSSRDSCLGVPRPHRELGNFGQVSAPLL
jgi:hypothetical protein